VPARFQQSRTKGARKPANGFCVTRRSRFGNPFPVPLPKVNKDPAAHAAAVARYREWITSPERAELLARARRELRGRDLGCYCKLDFPCHADVLLELVNQD
jgi:Domain of unknown function (DUF4326)